MSLRGKNKQILESSIDAALLGVEVYNKPRTTFRSQNFIILMTIAWTRLFHAYFHKTIGDKYYHKKSDGKYVLVDGEKKTWELSTCVDKFGKLNKSVEANLRFFIELRNKIEHRTILSSEMDSLVFGECQSLLYNYETILQELFGPKYALHENLVFSLQFSRLRGPEQNLSTKTILHKEVQDVVSYISKYRNDLSEDIYNSQEFSIKLICVPRISNTNRHDLAIEFVKWSDLNEEDKKKYTKINSIIKERVIEKEVVKSITVVERSNENISLPQLMASTTNPDMATTTLVYKTLSDDIFEDVNKILQANERLSPDSKSFKFDSTIYYRVYINRDKLNVLNQGNIIKLLATTGLRFYAPCLFWFNLLPDDVFAEVLKDFVSIPKYPGIQTALAISILLGTNVCDWVESKLKTTRARHLIDDRMFSTFQKMRDLTEKDDVKLAAIQRNRSSGLSLPDKTKLKCSELLENDTNTICYLTEFCKKVADGNKEYRGICRLLDILAFGANVQKRGYKITKFLCV